MSVADAALRTRPGTSTPDQRRKIVVLGKRKGLDLAAIRDLAGGRLHDLSSADASALIVRLGGGALPNPPGKKPAPYAGNRKTNDAVRMIAPGHVDQIERLLVEYFGSLDAGRAWLRKDFRANEPRELLTAQRAGQVIGVLKRMIERRANESPSALYRGRRSLNTRPNGTCSASARAAT